ncbi:MAG TPA: hypothetical protein VLM05_07085 [Mycobacteriales bacterium]|nr:hypothetical protein [Mycobacteriales bacterium]
MLDLETRQEILGITVFQDADRSGHYLHLPAQPHISRDGAGPMFDLFTFSRGGTAGQVETGGFLTMTVDVGIGALADRIVAKLKEQTGRDDITLAAVPFSKSTVRIVALGEDSKALTATGAAETTADGSPLVAHGPRFVEDVLGASSSSMDELNRAIFSLSLTEDGAAFMLGALESAPTARMVGAIYDMEYAGLLAAYDLEIEIDFKSSYEYVRSLFTLGTLFFKAEVDNVVENLKREQHIRIKEVSRTLELSTPEAVQARQSHIDQIVRDLATGALFQPALSPGQPRNTDPVVTATDPTGSVGTPATGTQSPQTEQLMSALAQGPSAGVAVGQGQAMAGSIPGQSAGGSGGQAGGTGTGTGTGGTAGTGGQGTGGTGGTSASATDLWNKLGRPQAAYTLRNITQEEQRTVTYNLSQVTAQKQTVAPQSFIQFLSAREELAARVHEVDLGAFFQRIDVNVNAADIDFARDGIEQVTVQLRYGRRPGTTAPKDTAQVILRSPADKLDVTFFADDAGTQTYDYKLTVDYTTGFGIGARTPRIEGPWTTTEARSLAVHPGSLSPVLPLSVELAPNVGAEVSEIQAVVRYRRPDQGVDDSQLLHLRADARAQGLPVRLVDAGDRVEVVPTVFYADGASETLPVLTVPDPASGQPSSTCVLSVPRGGFLTGDLLMLDPLGELTTVVVDTQVSQRGTVVDARSTDLGTAGARQAFAVRLPDRTVAPVLRYKQRRLYRDGGMEDGDWTAAGASSLVVGIPAEGVGTTTVTYLGPPPSQLGCSGLVLDLAYADPGGDPRFDQTASLLLTDDPAGWTQDWKYRLVHRDQRTYSWTLTLLLADGTSSVGPTTQDQRPRLILRIPQA